MGTFSKQFYRYRKMIVAVWLLMIIGFAVFAVKLPSVLGGNGFEMEGSYKTTQKLLVDEFGMSQSQIIALFTKESSVSEKEFQSAIKHYLDLSSKLSDVSSVQLPLKENGMIKENLAYGLIYFDEEAAELDEEIDALRALPFAKEGISVQLTGEPVVVKDMNKASQEDLAKAEAIGLPVALVVLLFAFGGLIAAGIPLLMGIVTVVASMGVVYFFSCFMDLSIFILNIIPMIGLALSIDFALLFINRFKEELEKQQVEGAITTTIQTAGRSVIFSGLCVFIGLAGMLFIDIDIFRNVALGGMAVVFVSVLSAVTFLPAVLALLGTKVNRFNVLRTVSDAQSKWRSFAQAIMKRPILMTAISLVILLTALIPIRDMKLEIPGADALPEGYESRAALETFNDTFTDEGTAEVFLILENENKMMENESLNQAAKFVDQIENHDIVKDVNSIFTALNIQKGDQLLEFIQQEQMKAKIQPAVDSFIRDKYMLVKVTLKTPADSKEAKKWVRSLEKKEADLTVHIGGYPKFEQEIFDEISQKAPYGLLLVLVSTYLILMVAFRSILIPLKAIIMNILSLSATFGLLVWLFQGGHFGLTESNIGLVLPVFVFGLVFGLSMDYEVFLISRIHEVYQETKDNDHATVEGLTSTSKIITSAALIMIVVTGAFAFTGVTPVKQMGVGIALAIFIDATIVRMILVPSLMKLLGDANWWFFNKKKATRNAA
ncbi:MAG TPA: MMPL family transporter [Bacillus sp. (in: firmicutes)]|nr:MMPL family transporter [Bacillus sp. (in: firmicutes)]